MMSIHDPILITGAAGFVGANLTRELVLGGHTIHILLKQSTNPWRLKDILSKIVVHRVNLLDKKKVAQTVSRIKPQTVYHLASYGNYSFQSDPEQIFTTNILGALYLLEALATTSFQCFILSGTSSEYGAKNHPMREDERLDPQSFYAVSKAAVTHLMQVYNKVNSASFVTLRLFSVYGPYEESSRFIPTLMKCLIKGQPIQLTKNPARRDFIFVEDAVTSLIQAAKLAKKLKGEIINIGTGKEYTNQQVVRKLFAKTKKRVLIEKGAYPNRNWDNHHWVADSIKARKLLDWQPHFTLADGLLKTYDWFVAHQKLYNI